MLGSDQMQDGVKFLQMLDKHDIMGKILRLCSKKDQQAAYKVCKGMRDACNHNIRTVEAKVEVVYPSTVRGQPRRLGSNRLCPEGAYNIKSLHVICKQEPTGTSKRCTDLASGFKDEEAIIYLQQLLDTQAEQDRTRQSKQLTTVTELVLSLALTDTQACDTVCECVARLLDFVPNVRHIRANLPALTALSFSGHEQNRQILSLTVEDIRPEQLSWMPTLFRNLLNLDIRFVTEVVLPPELPQLSNLANLHISISRVNTDPSYVPPPNTWAPLAGLKGLKRFSLVVAPDYQTSVTFPAQHVTGLALQELILNGCMISNHLMLASMPCLKSFQVGCAYSTSETTNMGVMMTANCWPALQYLEFLGPVTESVVRALCLPPLHPQLNVTFAARQFVYNVDRAADAQFGFMGVTCMAEARAEKVNLSGAFAGSALLAMSQHRIPLRKLHYYGKLLPGDMDNVQFPKLVKLFLYPPSTPDLRVFVAMLTAFPSLTELRLPRECEEKAIRGMSRGHRKFSYVNHDRKMVIYTVMEC